MSPRRSSPASIRWGEDVHYLRVRNSICKSVRIAAGDRVRVVISVRDRSSEISIPEDVMNALRAAGVVDQFKALTLGKRSYQLRVIEEAVKPATRAKRIRDLVEEARARKAAR